MRKKIAYLFLVLSSICFLLGIYNYSTIYNFNHTAVKNNIQFMTSDDFKGRLSGTLENQQIAAYVKSEFEKNNLKSLNGNYYEDFKTSYPKKIEGSPYLKIVDSKGQLIKEYTYGKDYKEDMLNFKKNNVSFNKKDKIVSNTEVIQVTKDKDSFVFYVAKDDNLSFRSSFISTAANSMYIMISKTVHSEIKDFLSKGYTISTFIPFEVTETNLSNVIGYIEGKDPKAPPLIFSGHFDHVGSDLGGNMYGGALDNASGISFVLELSKYVKSLGKPERNILFIGFNAEEFGCLGSENFVETHKDYLKGAKVFNFDMIGSDNAVPMCLMGGKKDTAETPFMKDLSTTCTNEKIYFNYLFEDASDHEAFRKNNIDAITFSDNDVSRIHTPNDKVEFISTSAIDRCFKVVSKEVIKHGFNSNILLIYYKPLTFSSLFIVSICLFVILYKKKK